MISRAAIEGLGGRLGIRLDVVIAAQPIANSALSAPERAIAGQLPSAFRRAEWLTGRAALKALLTKLGRDNDTAQLAFPHAALSLTHTGGLAVAVHAAAVGGIGVDLERPRAMPAASGRLFLTEAELCSLGDSQPADLLRVWTVKEALLKADPDNGGRWLGHYSLDDARTRGGTATSSEGRRFRYATLSDDGTYLSIAIHEPSTEKSP